MDPLDLEMKDGLSGSSEGSGDDSDDENESESIMVDPED
jgi:hypothetical protein